MEGAGPADEEADEDAGTDHTKERNDHAESEQVLTILIIVLGFIVLLIAIIFVSWAIACCQASDIKKAELERMKKEGPA